MTNKKRPSCQTPHSPWQLTSLPPTEISLNLLVYNETIRTLSEKCQKVAKIKSKTFELATVCSLIVLLQINSYSAGVTS